jgi:hypothetical protein
MAISRRTYYYDYTTSEYNISVKKHPEKYRFIKPYSVKYKPQNEQGVREIAYAIGDIVEGEHIRKESRKDGFPTEREVIIKVNPKEEGQSLTSFKELLIDVRDNDKDALKDFFTRKKSYHNGFVSVPISYLEPTESIFTIGNTIKVVLVAAVIYSLYLGQKTFLKSQS